MVNMHPPLRQYFYSADHVLVGVRGRHAAAIEFRERFRGSFVIRQIVLMCDFRSSRHSRGTFIRLSGKRCAGCWWSALIHHGKETEIEQLGEKCNYTAAPYADGATVNSDGLLRADDEPWGTVGVCHVRMRC